MDVNFHIVFDDLSEQSGTITLEQVAELLAYLIAKHLIAQANRARIKRHLVSYVGKNNQTDQPTGDSHLPS